MDIKKDWSLRLAIALPLAMIVFVAASIYIPRFFAPKPAYGFVYVANDTSKGYFIPEYALRIVDGQLVKEPTQRDESVPTNMKQQYAEPHLYRYDSATEESTSITFEEAAQLKLDDRSKSPDGFEVSQGGGYDGPFGGSSEPALYLVGHFVSQKLDLRGATNVYDFEFIGWVIE
ncbi:MAG: hypothetical protein PHT88_03905 [Candidatus Moranbacteria bacterium]|nr:hypothetical protein [Candidatus Moranbacteria bacterium]